MSVRPTVLVVLDGFGYSPTKEGNAIALANTPYLDAFLQNYPHTLLEASGQAVGLLPGTMGNSQVGHMALGTGSILMQPITSIHNAIADQSFFSNPLLVGHLNALSASGKTLHIMGLLSDGGVHSHMEHLFAYIKAAQMHDVKKIAIHAFLDGRDTPPQSAPTYLQMLENRIKSYPNICLSTIHGRFYAMDRDNNWDRTQQSYRAMTECQQVIFNSWQETLAHYYAQGITDEFIPPTRLKTSCIQKNDGIIFFNVRSERARQLTTCFTQFPCDSCASNNISLSFFITPVTYKDSIKTTALFEQQSPKTTLKQQLAQRGYSLFTIAEKEKYAHVTYFFDGGQETAYSHETRILIPSIKTKNYVTYPCMSAREITHTVLESLQKDRKGFYLINYANADMVGHSGNLEATIKAIECLDQQLGQLYDMVVKKYHGTLYITADHGKAECVEKDGKPFTAHTLNKVPFIMIDDSTRLKTLPPKELSEVAHFILDQMSQNN